LKEIPDAAMDVLDDFSQFIEGDSNMLYAGRKYPKSVCMKAQKLKEIFPEGDLQQIAEFIKKLPATFTIDQIADVYFMRVVAADEMKDQQE